MVVVKLRNCGKHVLRETPHGVVADCFTCGTEPHPKSQEKGAHHRVIVGVAGESRHVVDDDVLHAALVFATEFQQVLESRTVHSFRGLAGVLEYRGDVHVVTGAVVVAGSELGRQGEVLCLFLR